MAHNFLAVEREQDYLLPPSIADWLPEDHLAWFVLDAVDEMDLSPFYAAYRSDGWGAASFDPKMMVALLVYAYCIGVRSSREIERACHLDVAFRVIAANRQPDHTTVARFRKRHEEAIKGVFSDSLRLCAAAGMASVGTVALDGTKVGAPAALSSNRTKAHIDEVVNALFSEAEATDEAEDERFGDTRGDETPAELRGRKDRKDRFKAAKELLDGQDRLAKESHEAHLAERSAAEEHSGKKLRGRKPKEPKPAADRKANTADPESRIMKTKQGWVQGYNAQAVANEDQVVVAADVTDEANDVGQLHPMLDTLTETLAALGIDETPDVLLADAGYCSEENLADLQAEDPDCYIATRNTYRNPTPRTGRRGPLPEDATLVERMDRKVSTKAGKKVYARRAAIIEPVFAQTKDTRGARRFMRRGLSAARSEWQLLMGTHNLLKLYRRSLAEPSLSRWWRMAA